MALALACGLAAAAPTPSLSALELPSEQAQTMSPARALLLGRFDLIPSDVGAASTMAARILHVNREYTIRQEAEQQGHAQKALSEPARA